MPGNTTAGGSLAWNVGATMPNVGSTVSCGSKAYFNSVAPRARW